MRIGDKIRRLHNISNTGVTLVEDESFRDTLVDLHNYAAMAVLLLDSNDKMESTSEEEEEMESTIVNVRGSHAKHTWLVPSRSGKEEYEVVRYQDGSMSCTCKGFEYHDWCYHCIAKKGENVKNAIESQHNKCENKQNNTHKLFVQRSTDRSKQYEVTKNSDGEMSCTCEGFTYRKWCKQCEQYKN